MEHEVITKWNKYFYNVRQLSFLQIGAILLQSGTWKLAEAQDLLARHSQSRMERISSFSLMSCAEGCHQKLWLKMAKEILGYNKINVLLELGREYNHNILLVRPANCGKTFLLNPLREVCDTYSNTSSNKYAFVENKELAFLNDLQWSQDMIPWQELLKEGGGSEPSLDCT